MPDTHDKDYDKEYNKTGCLLGILAPFLLFGGVLNHKAKKKYKEADEIWNSASEKYNDALNRFEFSSFETKTTVNRVVLQKKQILKTEIKRFIKAYKRLAPQLQLAIPQNLNTIKNFTLDRTSLLQMQQTISAYERFDESRLGDKAFDIALMMVTDGTVSSLSNNIRDVIRAGKIKDEDLKRKSVDELKIQSIGIIWQFSSVAFEFGVSALTDYVEADSELARAKLYASEVEVKVQEIEGRIQSIDTIHKYAQQHKDVLENVYPLMQKHMGEAVNLIKDKDNIFHFGRIKKEKFTSNELGIIASACAIAGVVKAVIDAPIINKSGEVYEGQDEIFTIKEALKQYNDNM